ncbi:MAG: EVE domain-containing protein [Gammaproteobacteria bacterium]|nr:EVE domain-containing protein [Gammaproteobacteria bacterium]
MRSWIFQGKPERYPLKEKLVKDNRETWLVSRYKDEISKGDIVLFWSSGNENIRGLYGWGLITQNSVQYYDDWGYGIEVLYKVRFKNHIGINQIRKSGILNNNVLLRMPIGTNFKISVNEYQELSNLLQNLGETAPPVLNGGQDNE